MRVGGGGKEVEGEGEGRNWRYMERRKVRREWDIKEGRKKMGEKVERINAT